MIYLYKRTRQLFAGTEKLVWLSVIFAFIAAFDGVIYPYFLGRFTDILTIGAYDQIWLIIILWGLSLIGVTFGNLLYGYFLGRTRQSINISLKDRVLKKAYKKGNEQVSSSEYINTILQDIKQVETQYVNSAIIIIYCVLQGLIALMLVLMTHWQVGIVFILLGFIPSSIPKLTEKWLKESTKNWQKENQKYTDALKDGLQARNLVKRYDATNNIFKRLKKILSVQEEAYFIMNFRQKVSQFGVNSLYYLTTLIGLAYGVYIVIQGQISVGELITIYMAADRVTSPLVSLFTYYSWMIGTEPLVAEMMDEKVESDIPTLPKQTSSCDYLIKLNNVSVGYEDKKVMSNVNMVIEEGDRILIKGPSGSGKSTLVRTIMNEIDKLSGDLLYGKKLEGEGTHHFAVVEQKPFLFNDTLKYNLTLGQEIEERKLVAVLNKVGLSHLANYESLNNVYGENHHQLSGGEMKRLEVARAWLYRKGILIVDEALSGLDSKTADQLNQVIINYPGTVLDIEHHIDSTVAARFNKKILI